MSKISLVLSDLDGRKIIYYGRSSFECPDNKIVDVKKFELKKEQLLFTKYAQQVWFCQNLI